MAQFAGHSRRVLFRFEKEAPMISVQNDGLRLSSRSVCLDLNRLGSHDMIHESENISDGSMRCCVPKLGDCDKECPEKKCL
jgi:hypothetical protein